GVLNSSGSVQLSGGASAIVTGSIAATGVQVNASSLGGNGTVAAPVLLGNGSVLTAGLGGSGPINLSSLTLGSVLTDSSPINVTRNAVPAIVNITGGLTVNSGSGLITVNVNGAAPAAGQYPLINYTGTALSPTQFAAFTLGSLPNRVTANLVNDTA